jgi:hypothetical protein
MRWRRPSSDPEAAASAAPPAASALDAAAYADGVADAGAGVPDPLAESDEGRQPAARLQVYGASVRTAVQQAAGQAQLGLDEVERLKLAIDGRIEATEESTAAAERTLAGLPPGEHRHLADWRMTVMVLAIAVALPFEIYLTALSLEFLDLGEAGRRMVTLGVALSVALGGLLAAHDDAPFVDEESIHGRRPSATGLLRGIREAGRNTSLQGVLQTLAVLLLVGLVVALAILRYGAVGRSTIWEGLGSLAVLAIVAAVFALWVGFVHRRLQHADAVNANWLRRRRYEWRLGALREQLSLLLERREGLAAEVAEHGHRGTTALREATRRFDALVFSWWAGYQSTNRTASPEIRGHAEAIRHRIELDVSALTQELEARVLELRRWLDTGAPPLPSTGEEPIAP